MKNDFELTWFDNFEKNFKKEHPIKYWIDYTLFKNVSGFCGYVPHYVLFHPWVIIKEVCNQIKWFMQRGFRGYDQRAIWSIDYYLAKMIPLWIRDLKKSQHGVPCAVFDDKDLESSDGIPDEVIDKAKIKYDIILNEISEGFESYEKMQRESSDSDTYKRLKKKFDRGFSLFKKYYETLWY